jgi:protein TonB
VNRKSRYVPMILVCGTLGGAGFGAYALVRHIVSNAPSPPKQVVQEIHLIRPPPPPPDQPPPPPPPEEQKLNIPDPQQLPDPTPSNQPPPAANLGLDAEGGAGGDAFGLVGNKGGRDITATGGSAFAWYAGLLKDQVQNLLNTDKQVRNGPFRVLLRAWVSQDGTVQKMEIMRGSGNADRDRAIQADLLQIKHMSQARPAGMPDVISLEVRAQG